MRILIDARLYGLEYKGVGRYVMHLVKNVLRYDNKNEYIILFKEKYFNQLNHLSSSVKHLSEIEPYSVAEQVKLPRLISKISPNLVHFPHFNVPILYKGEFVVTIHDLTMHKVKGVNTTTRIYPQYLIKRVGYRKVFKNAVLKSRKIIVPSVVVKNEVVQYYKIDPQKVSVIYEGVTDLSQKQEIKEEYLVEKYSLKKPYFIYAGGVYPHKNLERLISAIVRLNQQSRVTFAIVCTSSIFTKRLQETIDRYSAKAFVKLLGYVEDAQLSVLYKNAAAFVYPSLYEGFGLPGLEAISAGTLVAASDISVFKEIYKNHAYYFDPYRVESIEETLKKILYGSAILRAEKIKNGQTYTKKYSWSKMAKETVALYNSVLRVD